MTPLPFEYDSYERFSDFEIMYKGVKFTRAFGPFEKGVEYDEVSVDLISGEMISYDMRGNKDDECLFDLTPRPGG